MHITYTYVNSTWNLNFNDQDKTTHNRSRIVSALYNEMTISLIVVNNLLFIRKKTSTPPTFRQRDKNPPNISKKTFAPPFTNGNNYF